MGERSDDRRVVGIRPCVAVPFAGGCEYRERARGWVVDRYRQLGWQVVEGTVTGEWCKARAVDAAVRETDAEVVVVADADCWADQIVEAVEAVEAGAPWAVPHDYVERWTQARTDAFWQGREVRGREEHHQAVLGGGVVVLRRADWLRVPLDPRFVGWGHEDHSWGMALTCLLGEPVRLTANLTHFWHPPQPRYTRRVGSQEGRMLERRYWNARSDPEVMQALVDEAKGVLSGR